VTFGVLEYERSVALLKTSTATMWGAVGAIALRNLPVSRTRHSGPLRLLDPALGVVELSALEAHVVGSPLFQRLRPYPDNARWGAVYPAVSTSKFQAGIASLGMLANEIRALQRSSANELASHELSQEVQAVRLAVLLGQIATIPYGDIRWADIASNYYKEFEKAGRALDGCFHTRSRLNPERIVSAYLLLSNPFLSLMSTFFGDAAVAKRVILLVVAAQLGDAAPYSAKYLVEFVTGPLSAGRLSALLQTTQIIPLVLDIQRMIHSLRVVGSDRDRVGLSSAAQADEIEFAEYFARERLNDHPVVQLHGRIVQRLTVTLRGKAPLKYRLAAEFAYSSEYSFLEKISRVKSAAGGKGHKAAELATLILTRRLPQKVTRFKLNSANDGDHEAADLVDSSLVELEIEQRLQKSGAPSGQQEPMVFVTLSSSQPQAEKIPGVDGSLLATLGPITGATTGHVWAANADRQNVRFAAEAILATEFGSRVIFDAIGTAGALVAAPMAPERVYARAVVQPASKPICVMIEPKNLRVGPSWLRSDERQQINLAEKLSRARPSGFSPKAKRTTIRLIDGLTSFHEVAYLGGRLKSVKFGNERELHELVRDHLRSRRYLVDDGLKVAGGELDLLFEKAAVIEFKMVRQPIDAPHSLPARFVYQTRRYGLALGVDLLALVIGYRPRNELGHAEPSSLVDIQRSPDGRYILMEFWVPVAYTTPSRAGEGGELSKFTTLC